MRTLKFAKMSGAGNDFVLLDWTAAKASAQPLPRLAQKLCDRRTAIGADGLLVLVSGAERPTLRYFNADGSEAFCGNGARCAAWWLFSRGIRRGKKEFDFNSDAGRLQARIKAPEVAAIAMPEPRALRLGLKLKAGGRSFLVDALDTGVPHAVATVKDLKDFPVFEYGRALRRHSAFAPAGANVNFIAKVAKGWAIRTYERGVEDETLACGTGATAAAIIAAARGAASPVTVIARGGELKVHFKRSGPRFTDVWLEGPAQVTYEGEISL